MDYRGRNLSWAPGHEVTRADRQGRSRRGKSPGLPPTQTSRHADGVGLPKVEAGFILVTDGRFVSGIRFH
jgi:hypothetical protein